MQEARTIQSWRGMPDVPKNRVKKYSPESYAAQYGIEVELAEEFHSECVSHEQVQRMIYAHYKVNPDAYRQAISAGVDERQMSEEEVKEAEEFIKRQKNSRVKVKKEVVD